MVFLLQEFIKIFNEQKKVNLNESNQNLDEENMKVLKEEDKGRVLL